ncbi:MAG: L,D-transpeptidase [Methylovirgula sp.]|jgi:lipoprotein-anchoring transpeptidase ErfK/SrfK
MAVATGFAALAFSQPAMAQDAPSPNDPAVHVDHSAPAPTHGTGPRVIVHVDLTAQSLHVQFPDGSQEDWPISSGRPGLDTPDGTYKAQWVDPDHQSKQYQDAPMPYAVFFDLKGHAFHGSYQKKFGMAVSHGCVRLPVNDAKKLYDAVKVAGADVEIVGQARGNAWAVRQEDQRELAAQAAQPNNDGSGGFFGSTTNNPPPPPSDNGPLQGFFGIFTGGGPQ